MTCAFCLLFRTERIERKSKRRCPVRLPVPPPRGATGRHARPACTLPSRSSLDGDSYVWCARFRPSGDLVDAHGATAEPSRHGTARGQSHVSRLRLRALPFHPPARGCATAHRVTRSHASRCHAWSLVLPCVSFLLGSAPRSTLAARTVRRLSTLLNEPPPQVWRGLAVQSGSPCRTNCTRGTHTQALTHSPKSVRIYLS